MGDIVDEARLNHVGIVRQLLDNGVDINYRNYQGDTALLWAAWAGNIEVVRLLLERGADTTLRNNNGNLTALDLARKGNHSETVKLLETYEKPVEPPKAVETWEKMGAATVAHVGSYPALDKKLTTVFNFSSRDRTIISESLKTGTQSVGPSTSFNALPSSAIEEALDQFARLGGTPDRDFALRGTTGIDKPKIRVAG